MYIGTYVGLSHSESELNVANERLNVFIFFCVLYPAVPVGCCHIFCIIMESLKGFEEGVEALMEWLSFSLFNSEAANHFNLKF